MKAAFLPFNYERELYQRLQHLRQGTKSVDEYTSEFYALLARNELSETPSQLVSRYIGGLRLPLQDILNMFDPFTISEAHQHAIQAEKQLARRTQPTRVPPTTSVPPPRSTTGSSSAAPPGNRSSGSQPTGRPNTPFRCFNCGETGHRMSECRQPLNRTLAALDQITAVDDELPPTRRILTLNLWRVTLAPC